MLAVHTETMPVRSATSFSGFRLACLPPQFCLDRLAARLKVSGAWVQRHPAAETVLDFLTTTPS